MTKLTRPSPLPETGAVSEIQPTSVVAVHAQSFDVETLICPVAPDDDMMWVAGEISKRHGARCDTRNCSPLTMTLPSRGPLPSLAATRSSRLAVPCPDDGDNEIHGAALVAVHAHSGVVVTVTVPVPPPASTIIGGAPSET